MSQMPDYKEKARRVYDKLGTGSIADSERIEIALREAHEAGRREGWPPSAAFSYETPVEKFTGEARWTGLVVAAYLTTRSKLRYVVEVHPQGFQMIAVPDQLRAILSEQGDG